MKWRRGLSFSGGPHSVSIPLRVSERSAALLHYKFTKGAAGLEYIAARCEHVGGAVLYKRMLDQRHILTESPVYEDTREVTNSRTLDWILR